MKLERLVRRGSEGGKVLVLLHGIGSNAEDLMSFAPELDASLTVVTLQAPHPYGPGFSWFDIQWGERSINVDQVQALESVGNISSELLEIQAEMGCDHLLLGGFSQGAIMTLGVLLTRPELLKGAMLLSGRMLPANEELPPLEGTAEVPCLVQHGRFDPVLEVQGAREVRDFLISRSVEVEYHEYDMGHQVSYESLTDLKNWLARQA